MREKSKETKASKGKVGEKGSEEASGGWASSPSTESERTGGRRSAGGSQTETSRSGPTVHPSGRSLSSSRTSAGSRAVEASTV